VVPYFTTEYFSGNIVAFVILLAIFMMIEDFTFQLKLHKMCDIAFYNMIIVFSLSALAIRLSIVLKLNNCDIAEHFPILEFCF